MNDLDKIKKEGSVLLLSPGEAVSMHDRWFDIASPEHFWLDWRYKILKRFKEYFPKKDEKIFEIGCGNGVVLHQLSSDGLSAQGCDLNLHALKMVKSFKGKVYLYNIYDENPELLESFETVLLLDVIEHIEDDVDFLRQSAKYLKKGGKLFVNVPAGAYLFGPYDKEVGHLRRYSKAQLNSVMHSAGLEVKKTEYWAFTLIFFAFMRKIIHAFRRKNIIESGMNPPGKWGHLLLKTIENAELKLIGFPIIGASVMSVGIKK